MTMSKKDFVRAAAIVRSVPEEHREYVREAFADLFLASSDRFDYDKFRIACEVKDGV